MLLLGLDTATPAVTVTLLDDGRVRAGRRIVDARRHGELLAPAIVAVLEEARVAPAELAAIAVGLGPGPFTGLRVGIVTAATLADGLAVPAYAAGSLDLIADGADGRYAVATDARRREVYWAVYYGQRRACGPAVDRPAAVAATLDAGGVGRVIGDGAHRYREVFGPAADLAGPRYPDPARLWALVADRLCRAAPGDRLAPLYLRRPDAVAPGAPKPVTAAGAR